MKNKLVYLIIGFLVILLAVGYFGYRYLNLDLNLKKCVKCEKCEKCNTSNENVIFNNDKFTEVSVVGVIYMYYDGDNKPKSLTYIRHDYNTNKLIVGVYNNENKESFEEYGCISSDKSDECLSIETYKIIGDSENPYILVFDSNSANIYKIKLSDYLVVEKKLNYRSSLYTTKQVSKIEDINSWNYIDEGYVTGDSSELKVTYSDGTIEYFSSLDMNY